MSSFCQGTSVCDLFCGWSLSWGGSHTVASLQAPYKVNPSQTGTNSAAPRTSQVAEVRAAPLGSPPPPPLFCLPSRRPPSSPSPPSPASPSPVASGGAAPEERSLARSPSPPAVTVVLTGPRAACCGRRRGGSLVSTIYTIWYCTSRVHAAPVRLASQRAQWIRRRVICPTSTRVATTAQGVPTVTRRQGGCECECEGVRVRGYLPPSRHRGGQHRC
jgi:hypothetical protein